MTAIVVIGVCLLAACIGAIFGPTNERAAMAKDERGWWPGTPRRR